MLLRISIVILAQTQPRTTPYPATAARKEIQLSGSVKAESNACGQEKKKTTMPAIIHNPPTIS
jgi:hypothetical protein